MHIAVIAALLLQVLSDTRVVVATGQAWCMAVDKYGNLFWSESGSASVKLVTPSGVVSTILTGLAFANSMAVDATGNIYVLSDQSYTYLLHFCPVVVPGVSYGPCQSISYVTGLTQPQGIAIASNKIYISDTGTYGLRGYPFNGSYSMVGSNHVQVYAICLDALENLYVANFGNGDVQKITPDGIQTVIFNCAFPDGLFVDKKGNLYVASYGDGNIYVVAPDLSVTVAAGGFIQPYSVAVDFNGNLFVGDFGNNQIVKVSGYVTTSTTTTSTTYTSYSSTTSSLTTSTKSTGTVSSTLTVEDLILTYLASQDLPSGTMTSTNVLKQQINQPSQPFLIPFYLYLVAVAVLLLFICVACYCGFVSRRSKQYKKTIKQIVRGVEPSQYGYNITQTQPGTVTLQVTAHELSIPGHMMREFGIDFIQTSLIAQGGMSSIYKCKLLKNFTQKQVVVKNFEKNVSDMTLFARDSFYQELAIYNAFRDQDQFARCFGYTEVPACILLQYYEYGSLTSFIFSKSQKYTQYQLLVTCLQISIGIKFMHSRALVHCDLKPDNILLERRNGAFYPKITDFGISRLVDDAESRVKAFQVSRIKGLSAAYAPPETWTRYRDKQLVSSAEEWKAGDVYSLVLIFQEMLNRKRVWSVQQR